MNHLDRDYIFHFLSKFFFSLTIGYTHPGFGWLVGWDKVDIDGS